MKVGSLCSGAGGLDMAVEDMFDAHTVWHCETDPAASKVLAARWPGVPNHGDLITTEWTSVEPVDIMCAGFPCQPFSIAGKRRGLDDERAIWPHIGRAIGVLRPRIVVLENVSALLASAEFTRVADSLATFGYDLRWTCLRASDIGAPHKRERLFVVAHADSAIRETLSGRPWTGHAGRLQPVERGSQDWEWPVADAEGDGWHEGWPESAGFERGFDAAVSGHGPVDLLPKASDGQRQDCMSERERTPSLVAVDHYLPTHAASDGTGGGRHPDARVGHSRQLIDYALLDGSPRWGKYAPAIHRWEALTRPAPAPTEPNRNGKPRLNPAFSEWMMGWPAGWCTQVDGISRNDQLRIIGNGVVPQQAQAALRWLLTVSEAAA